MALTALIALITRTCVIRRAEATADHGTLAVKSTRTSIAWIGKWRGGSGSDRGSWRRCQRRRRRSRRRRRRRRCVRRRRRCVTGSAAAWRSPNIVRARDRGAVCRRCVAVRTAQSRLRATEQMRHCVLSVEDSRCIRSALPSSCRGRWRRRRTERVDSRRRRR